MRLQLNTTEKTIKVDKILSFQEKMLLILTLLPIRLMSGFTVRYNSEIEYLSPIWVNPEQPWVDMSSMELVDGIYNIELTDEAL